MATQAYQKRDLYTEVTYAVSQRPYSGCNVVLLWMKQHAVPRYLTYNQAQELGGNVRGSSLADLNFRQICLHEANARKIVSAMTRRAWVRCGKSPPGPARSGRALHILRRA
jgi:N-terminal domain of anti-restriction factor ArdC